MGSQLKRAQSTKSNREDCDGLVEKVCEFFNVIADELRDGTPGLVDHRFGLRLQAFQWCVPFLPLTTRPFMEVTRPGNS